MRHSLRKVFSTLISRTLGYFPGHLPIVYKIALLIAGLIIVCSVALSSILFYDQARIMGEQIDDFGNTVVNHLARSATEPLLAEDRLALGVLASSLVVGDSLIGTEILAPDGETLVRAGLSPFERQAFSPAEIIEQAESRQRWTWQLHVSDKVKTNVVSFVSPIFFQNLTAGYALVTFSQQTLDRSKEKAIISIAVATVIIVMFGVLMAYLLSKRLSRPVDHFMEGVEAYDSGNYNFRFADRRRNEIGQLMSAFDRMAEGMVRKTQVEKALTRYLSPQIARQVIANLDSVELGGKRISGSVLFADIVGFTRMSENMNPENLAALLNHYFSLITGACELSQGTVDKYMGDCVMLIFGAPEADEDHAFHAAMCGLLIRKLVECENRRREKDGLFPVDFRIGINSGSMLAGNMGSREKMEYTVVGDSVNLASRLCSISEAGQIVVSREFCGQQNIRARIVAREHVPMQLRGVEDLVDTFLLQGLSDEYQKTLEDLFARIAKPV